MKRSTYEIAAWCMAGIIAIIGYYFLAWLNIDILTAFLTIIGIVWLYIAIEIYKFYRDEKKNDNSQI